MSLALRVSSSSAEFHRVENNRRNILRISGFSWAAKRWRLGGKLVLREDHYEERLRSSCKDGFFNVELVNVSTFIHLQNLFLGKSGLG